MIEGRRTSAAACGPNTRLIKSTRRPERASRMANANLSVAGALGESESKCCVLSAEFHHELPSHTGRLLHAASRLGLVQCVPGRAPITRA